MRRLRSTRLDQRDVLRRRTCVIALMDYFPEALTKVCRRIDVIPGVKQLAAIAERSAGGEPTNLSIMIDKSIAKRSAAQAESNF